jgi:putative transposase
MNLEIANLYHIYNQGNNSQKIFYNRNNYLFFLEKIKTHLLPFADIVAWCLMPNHFHLMVYVNHIERETYPMTTFNPQTIISGRATSSRAHATVETHPMTTFNSKTSHRMSIQTLNQSIAIMLRSYTRAVNKQENRSGSLFKPHTKAECLSKTQGISPSFFNTNSGTMIHLPEKEYPQLCFNYIHNNPLKAGLVKHPEDWEFSSYRDYFGLRNGKIINKSKAEEFGLFISQ